MEAHSLDAAATTPDQRNRMNWQPIETAPRNGTPVLVWDGDMFWAYYSSRRNAWIDQQRDEWPEYEIKMWHPLPPPPVVKDSLTPALPMDDDLDEPLGQACSRENPECESCQ